MGRPIYFQVVSRGTLHRESAARNLPEGQWGRCTRGPLLNDRPDERPPLPALLAAVIPGRDSVKHVFMRNWDHRRGFGAPGAHLPRIRHVVGMS